MPERAPTCWNCGYELTGLQVDGQCPECGTDIWSREPPKNEEATKAAGQSLLWGVVSLVTFFACLGPFAGLVAIPALSGAARARRLLGHPPGWPAEIQAARIGRILGWIAIVLSLLVVGLYALFIVTGILGSLGLFRGFSWP